MAALNRVGDQVVMTLSKVEKVESIHGDLRVPWSSVRDVEALDDVIHAVHGRRLPGTGFPGQFAIGTFVTLGGVKTFAVVHHDTPRGVQVQLDGAAVDAIVIGCDDPEAVRPR